MHADVAVSSYSFDFVCFWYAPVGIVDLLRQGLRKLPSGHNTIRLSRTLFITYHICEQPCGLPNQKGYLVRCPRFIAEEGGLALVGVYGAEQERLPEDALSRSSLSNLLE